jgi:hypothetical protein
MFWGYVSRTEVGRWRAGFGTSALAMSDSFSAHGALTLTSPEIYPIYGKSVKWTVALTEFASIAKTNVYPNAEFTASDLKRGGSVLEAASDGKVVRITRRDTRFLLIREDYVMRLVAELTDTTPKSLEQMLEGFTAEDATGLRERMAAWRADDPVGSELI